MDMKGKFRYYFFCLALAFFSSCGLPTVSYLYPPTMTVNNTIISLQNDARNYESSEGSNQTYRGIEIFYHVYQNESSASSMLTTIGNLSDSYDNEPDTFKDIVTGSSYNFQRLRNTINLSQPLIPINASSDEMFYLNLKSNADWELDDHNNSPVYDGTTNISQIVRNITASNSATGFYSKDFDTTDVDYTGSTITSSATTVYIVFFAVSYGSDQTTVGQPVYSMPYIPSSYVVY